jgi:hypothetical protein
MKSIGSVGCTGVLFFIAAIVTGYAQPGQQGKPEGQDKGQEKGGKQQQTPQQQAPQQHGQQQPQQQHSEQQRQQSERATQQQQPQHAQPQQSQPQQHAEQQRTQQQAVQQRAQQPQQVQQQQQARVQQQSQRTQPQAKAWQQQRGWANGGSWQGGNSWQQDRSQHWSSDHRTWAQRGGYGGYYIPQDRFGVYFGSQHFFRIGALPTYYMGYPRFAHGGYSFLLLDPWPESWSDNWYSSDDVYIDYDNYDRGYYLYNRRYPQMRLTIMVAL